SPRLHICPLLSLLAVVIGPSVCQAVCKQQQQSVLRLSRPANSSGPCPRPSARCRPFTVHLPLSLLSSGHPRPSSLWPFSPLSAPLWSTVVWPLARPT